MEIRTRRWPPHSRFCWSRWSSRASWFNISYSGFCNGKCGTFFWSWNSRLLFLAHLKRECCFFIWQALFEYNLKENIRARGGGANVTPLYIATPIFNSQAHKDFSMYQWIFLHPSIDNWSSGVPKGSRSLWVWPCGSNLLGMALASKASYGHAQKGHAHKATPTKTWTLWEPQKTNFRSMDAKNPLKSLKPI